MRRRDFVTLIVGATVGSPLPGRAQQSAKIPRIGVLWHAGSAEGEGTNFTDLVKGFEDLGYVHGRNVVLEHRFPNELPDRFRGMAAELVGSGVDVLISVGVNASPYAKNATTTIPIIFVSVPDPIAIGLVKSIARPEGNLTGISNSATDVIGKRVEILKEMIADPIAYSLTRQCKRPTRIRLCGHNSTCSHETRPRLSYIFVALV